MCSLPTERWHRRVYRTGGNQPTWGFAFRVCGWISPYAVRPDPVRRTAQPRTPYAIVASSARCTPELVHHRVRVRAGRTRLLVRDPTRLRSAPPRTRTSHAAHPRRTGSYADRCTRRCVRVQCEPPRRRTRTGCPPSYGKPVRAGRTPRCSTSSSTGGAYEEPRTRTRTPAPSAAYSVRTAYGVRARLCTDGAFRRAMCASASSYELGVRGASYAYVNSAANRTATRTSSGVQRAAYAYERGVRVRAWRTGRCSIMPGRGVRTSTSVRSYGWAESQSYAYAVVQHTAERPPR